MESEVIEKTEASIKKIIDEGLTTNNLDTLYKLSKIKHMAKEDKNMNEYGNYNEYGTYNGRNVGYDAYGRGYNDYGRRGRDMKYRGEHHIDRMYNEYGRYEEGREQYNRGNYGAKDDTMKSLEYMLESIVDFVMMLKNDAKSQEEVELIKRYTQKIANM